MPPRTLSYFKDRDVTDLHVIKQTKVAALNSLDPPIETLYDLLTHYPRRWLDRTRPTSIKDLVVDEENVVMARVKRVTRRPTRRGPPRVEVDVFDGANYLTCVFFNQPWQAKRFVPGTEVTLVGRVTLYRGRRQMANPQIDVIGDKTGRVFPIYPESGKAALTSDDYREWMEALLRRIEHVVDPLDDRWRDRLRVIERDRAVRQIHQPDTLDDAYKAKHRLAIDELLRLQLTLVMRKRAVERDAKGIKHTVDGPLVERFYEHLPFELTGAQRRAIDAIARDLAGPHPMHRLLQGDVGSGKTIVAVTALLMGVDGGHQGALMAPTEVLAEQHYLSVRAMLAGLQVPDRGHSLFGERDLRVSLLTNRTTAKERAAMHDALRRGEVDILIGTHALITDEVAFSNLGVVVIDEQHRFGVEQRAALRGKGDDPDVLVMTATPIPRTAAMTVYGDLDMTEIDELPPGRTPIKTTWAQGPLEESAAWDRVRAEVEAGHQAYVVCPLIEESEKIEARSAEEEYERLAATELKGLRLGLLHGRVPSKDKEAVMHDFRKGDLDVLVATTVIEVGVDVPNATVMVIEDADRFGIAQLHQLRGRVGRGGAVSYCFLMGEATTAEGEERLAAVERTTDGFELAEVDLDLRGEGTILNTRQKGRSDLKLASLRRDRKLVELAREVAFEIADADPFLETLPLLREEVEELVDPEEREFLFKS